MNKDEYRTEHVQFSATSRTLQVEHGQQVDCCFQLAALDMLLMWTCL